MSAQLSADIRTLFADLGIETEETSPATDLVIDRFEQWQHITARGTTGRLCCGCSGDVLLEAA